MPNDPNSQTVSIETLRAELEKTKALNERRVARERAARKSAEHLLEQKSSELYASNQELHTLTDELELRIHERTLELEKERNRAVELSRVKSDFLATMSHEIRTPINGIIGVLKLLENESGLTEEAYKLLSVAQHSSYTLLKVINDILDFSKIESGKFELESVEFNLKDVLTKTLKPFENLANEKGLKLICDYPNEISDFLRGDPFRITQILNNFLSNAFKFTSEGEIQLRLKLANQNQTLEFHVCDTGIGIPEDKKNHLFKDFSQIDNSTSRKYGGTGLGLVITKKLAMIMGGDVSFAKNQPKGSCFCAHFPYQPVRPKNSPENQKSFNDNLEVSQHQLTILLVDDNQVNLLIGEKLLTRLGHKVTKAESGMQAIDLCNKTTFDVILMDIQMPELDGYETTKILRQSLTTPIIALTANTSDKDQRLALEAGMNDFLFKPFEIGKMKQTLLHVCSR